MDSSLLLILLLVLLLIQLSSSATVQITEFLASNKNGITDWQGNNEDWIEIYNGGNAAVDLVDYSLTDDITTPQKWTFPTNTILPAGAYLIVFASNKAPVSVADTGGELHTNFKLAAAGEYLGLYYNPTGTVLTEFRPTFPAQTSDQSYGFAAGDTVPVFFVTPTPGAPNNSGSGPGLLLPVEFNQQRGFFTTPFSLVLSVPSSSLSTTLTTTIRYTLDGSDPTVSTTGTIYTGTPIAITTTTVVRAASFLFGADTGGSTTTTIITHTYIFLNDVIQQPAAIPGFPNGRLAATRKSPDEGYVPIDFAMDPVVVSEYSNEIVAALRSIPTIALSASSIDIFGVTGFYFGDDIEKKVSVEVFYPNTGDPAQQLNAGAESHSHNRLKRALRLNFRSDYGSRAWTTNMFRDFAVNGDTATNQVRRLILRSGNNRCWARALEVDATSYTHDQFYRDTQIAMSGGYGAHGSFVHLYLNGVYEGLYNAVERPDDTFGEAYFGGNDDDWFYTNHDDAGSKNRTRWDYLTKSLVTKNMAKPANYAELQEYLDVTAYADYLILNFYFGMTDWPHKNWYVIARQTASGPGPTSAAAQFVAWDGEMTLDRRQNKTRTGATIQEIFLRDTTSYQSVITDLWHSVRRNPEFMTLFQKRVTLHTSAGGALTVTAATERWDRINAFVDSAIIGESARWGDSLETLGGIFAVTRTRDVDFRNNVATVRRLLQINTKQFLDEIKLLDQTQCQGLLSAIVCFFFSIKLWLLDFFVLGTTDIVV
jgi:CotH kinase protein/Lamin Tail Domain/Chitobiase/beta-hexosaminidase C-terminal domain